MAAKYVKYEKYFKYFHDRILNDNPAELAIMGPQQIHINFNKLSKSIHLFNTVEAFQQKFLKAPILV